MYVHTLVPWMGHSLQVIVAVAVQRHNFASRGLITRTGQTVLLITFLSTTDEP